MTPAIRNLMFKKRATIPSTVSGLLLWFDANDGATLKQTAGGLSATADNDPVGQWLDKSGNGWHITQATAGKRPILKLANVGGLNSVRFDGVDDYLETVNPAALLKDINGATLIVVAKYVSLIGSSAYLATFNISSGSTASRLGLGQSSANLFAIAKTLDADPNSVATATGAATLNGSVYHSVAEYSNGDLFLNRDGVQIATNLAGSNGNTSNTDIYAFRLGAGRISSNFGNADICEVLTYDRRMSAGEIAGLLVYLKGKYGIL